jgi:hypothetical protein
MSERVRAWLTRRRKVTLRDCKVGRLTLPDGTEVDVITTTKELTDAEVEALRREWEAVNP